MQPCPNDCGYPLGGDIWILVLPDSYDFPSQHFQAPVCIEITPAIGLDLVPPEFDIALGPGAVIGATVPETAIHEDGHARSGEGDIGSAPGMINDWLIYPVTKSHSVQSPPNLHFRSGIALPSSGHTTTGRFGRWSRRLGSIQIPIIWHSLADQAPFFDSSIGCRPRSNVAGYFARWHVLTSRVRHCLSFSLWD